MTINFQRLLDVCKATELLPLGGFDMSTVHEVETDCGAVGCMIGNYNAMAGRKCDEFGSAWMGPSDWEYFGITETEYNWLFFTDAHYEGVDDQVFFELKTNWTTRYGDLVCVSREEALARLRKFIYYKLHKHEMCYDAKYGVREEARTKEGDHGFAARAVRETKEAMAVSV